MSAPSETPWLQRGGVVQWRDPTERERMAKGSEVAKEAQTAPQTFGLDESQFEFETVHSEAPSQVTFDEIGDTFVGVYMGQELIEFEDNKGQPQQFTQLKFLVNDDWFVVNAGYDLLQAYADIPVKTVTRTQLRTLVDVGQNDPMKSYRVDVARPRSADNTGG